jgi:alpha-aminoadipate carrier protein LysW
LEYGRRFEMTATTCIECEAPVPVNADLVCGEILMCPDCGVELEVTGTDPLSIELAPEVEEDWGE